MSLTIFVHRKRPEVAIVKWFRDANGNIDLAVGPVFQMSLEKFREIGHAWIRQHFEEYQKRRLSWSDVAKVFQRGEAARVMKDRSAVEINRQPPANLIFSPMEIEKYSLAYLKRIGGETHSSIPESCPPELFWTKFDDVLAIANEA